MNAKERVDERVTLLTKCKLEINGKKFDGLVDNISTLGALVELDRWSLMYIDIGDRGAIKLLLLSPVQYLCTVVRKYPKHIAIKFNVDRTDKVYRTK